MWPPSTPMSAAILCSAWARRTSSAVVARARSPGCLRTVSRTASIWSRVFCTACGPLILLGIQIEKKMAPRPPWRMRGMSMLPAACRSARLKFGSRSNCVVSSCVSTTIDEKCSFFARSEITSPATRVVTRSPPHTNIAARKNRISAQHLSESCGEILTYQPAEECLFPCGAVDFSKGFGERDFLGTRFDAVLRVGAVLNAAGLHDGVEAFARLHCAGRMHVEEAHLADDGGTYEVA